MFSIFKSKPKTDGTPSADTVVITSCESVYASGDSPQHLRLTTIGEMKVSGGIPKDKTTLCGRELHSGWDIRVRTAEDIQQSLDHFEKTQWRPGSLCQKCAPVALNILAGS